MNSIIQYTSKTFNTIINDINSDSNLRDKPDWFKNLIAGVGDVLSLCLNAQANQSYLYTCQSEYIGDLLLELIGYQRSTHSTSSGSIFFDINRNAIFPFTVLRSSLIAYSEGSFTIGSKKFESRTDEIFTAISETFVANSVTDLLTVARIYTTGELVRLSTAGTLPTAVGGDLNNTTDYFVIYDTDTTIKLARSRTNAYNGIYIDLTSNGVGVHTIYLFSKKVTVYQQTSIDQFILGQSDGITQFQEFDLPDAFILEDTLSITINSTSYLQVGSLVYSTSLDTHYQVRRKSDNKIAIRFGNGTYGIIPPAFDIYCEYAYGGGIDSNINVINKINLYGGSDSNLDGVSNYAPLTGGGDRESLSTAKILAPILLKTRDRFVTVADGESLAINYGGIIQAKVNKNIYGILSAQVVVVPSGGGAAPAPLLAALDTYLTDRTILESIDIRCISATYKVTNVTSTLKILTGYTWATVRDYYNCALDLIFSEVTQEIKNLYISDGINAVIIYINSKWAFSFTSADYTAIENILNAVTPHNFGITINISDVYGILDSVAGVDYALISLPAFPITFLSNEISQAGAMNTTQIP